MARIAFGSTRGETAPMGFEDAVAMGLAPDGGLLVPNTFPELAGRLGSWSELSYADLALAFLREFAGTMDPEALEACVRDAYAGFDHSDVAPLLQLDENLFVLELFHGPTLAFKDFALQLLGNLYERQIARTGSPINVLGATSGDTGAAAIHGLLGKKGVNTFILYPKGGVSPLQERQMTCTGSANVYPIAIEGSFDDAQRIVKEVFGDMAFRKRYDLSAVNSINLARVLAQCVYYFYGYFRLPEKQRARLEYVVPTGNFGNVLAGWWGRQMGLPVDRFCVATNQNDILFHLFEAGVYKVGKVNPSLAPSMDIQVASNFERFLYQQVGGNARRVQSIMAELRQTGNYTFDDFGSNAMRATRANDERILELTAEVHRRYDYTVDPHTACGFAGIDPGRPTVVLATAHPAKFPDALERAIGQRPIHPTLEALKTRTPEGAELPAEVDAIKRYLSDALG